MKKLTRNVLCPVYRLTVVAALLRFTLRVRRILAVALVVPENLHSGTIKFQWMNDLQSRLRLWCRWNLVVSRATRTSRHVHVLHQNPTIDKFSLSQNKRYSYMKLGNLTFLLPILRNFFNENLDLVFFFSSTILSAPAAIARLSCDNEMFLRGAGSGGLPVITWWLGSGASHTPDLRNLGLQLEARSRFSFSRTTGQSDFTGVGAGFRAKIVEEVSSVEAGG